MQREEIHASSDRVGLWVFLFPVDYAAGFVLFWWRGLVGQGGQRSSTDDNGKETGHSGIIWYNII